MRGTFQEDGEGDSSSYFYGLYMLGEGPCEFSNFHDPLSHNHLLHPSGECFSSEETAAQHRGQVLNSFPKCLVESFCLGVSMTIKWPPEV